MVNVTEYWDVVTNDAMAVSVNAGMTHGTAAEYLGFFMATNGNANPACGSLSRINMNNSGTLTLDILPGAREYIRWDANNRYPNEPPSGLMASKMGYTWSDTLDTLLGWNLYQDQIDSGLPPVVIFNYWNPQATGIWITDTVSGDSIHVYQQGSPISFSLNNDPANPEETWPCAENPEACPPDERMGHAVTGTGYAAAYDPDGNGPLPRTNWIICHDNWTTTERNVMIEWKAWQAMVTFDPGTRPVILNTLDSIAVNEGDSLTWTVRAMDEDGDSIRFSFKLSDGSSLPPWLSVRDDSILVIQPSAGDSNMTVRIIADDGKGGADTFNLRISVVSSVADAGANLSGQWEQLILTISGYDVDFSVPWKDFSMVEVINPSGKILKKIAVKTMHLVWDGLDNNGIRVPDGVYFIRLTGNKSRQLLKTALWR